MSWQKVDSKEVCVICEMCPNCGRYEIESMRTDYTFEYGAGNPVALVATDMLLFRCTACGEKYYGHEGAEAIENAVAEYLKDALKSREGVLGLLDQWLFPRFTRFDERVLKRDPIELVYLSESDSIGSLPLRETKCPSRNPDPSASTTATTENALTMPDG
jgi:YgiT-type zinc finger domain-containing protein